MRFIMDKLFTLLAGGYALMFGVYLLTNILGIEAYCAWLYIPVLGSWFLYNWVWVWPFDPSMAPSRLDVVVQRARSESS